MDYQQWMTQIMAERMKSVEPEFPENRAGRRAKARSTKKRGKRFTK
jgi:hypothetical protein